MRGSHILCTGPESDFNNEGDEIPVWFVYLADSEGEAVKTVYELYHREKAVNLARRMAHDRRLPLENEAGRA